VKVIITISYTNLVKLFFVVFLTILVSGCASTPQQEVTELNTSHPNYSSIECREARLIALQYDPKVAERMGTGFLLGFLGPIGLGLAVSSDVSENKNRLAVIDELKLQCEGDPRVSTEESKDPLSVRLFILKDLLTKELITEKEYNLLREKALEEL